MKKLLLFFLALSLLSCEKSTDINLVDSVPYLYTFHLKFVDTNNNNNLLEKIDQGILKNKLLLAKESQSDIDKYGINYVTIGNVLYLKIEAASLPDKRVKEIHFTITSKELFNDEQSHVIKTLWQWENNFDNIPMEVYLDNDSLSLMSVGQSFQYFLIK